MLFSTDLRLSTDGLYTVGCPSNGRHASSISALPALAAQTSAGGTACSLLTAVGSDSSDPPAIYSHARMCLVVLPDSWDPPGRSVCSVVILVASMYVHTGPSVYLPR